MTPFPLALDLLQQLVACPSVNPRGAVPSGPPYGEGALVRLLEPLLAGWGGAVEVREVSPGRFNLLARFEGRCPTRSLLLEAHGDTVAVEGMSIPPFTPVLRDGRLYGRGACDTKGAMAAILAGLRHVLETQGRPAVTIWFAATCNEEMGATGAHDLMARGFRADAAVVGEPTGLEIVHAHKGALRVTIETRGVAAHSSAPERGVNAIYKMRPILERLETVVAPSLARAPHPLLGPPTLSVGTIQGGTQSNIVPDHCRIEVDRRLVPGEVEREVVARITEGLDVRSEVTEYYPPLEEPRDSAVSAELAQACQRALGKAVFATAAWASNAGIFKAAGIPSVLFGPGSIAQAHTADEYLELDQLHAAAAVYAALIAGE